MKLAFVSRHTPTVDQIQLAKEKGFDLVFVSDLNAYNREEVKTFWENNKDNFAGVVVVNAAMALNFASLTWGESRLVIGVFENEMRPVEGGKPTFQAKSLNLWTIFGNGVLHYQ